MNVLAIDPGPTQSAFVVYEDGTVRESFICENTVGLCEISDRFDCVACEMLACFGMPVGSETFETAYYIGRIMAMAEHCRIKFHRVYRADVKIHLCGSMRAKDSNIRQALLDIYGGSRQLAIGTKKSKGPLYGVSSHCWSALAIAVTFCESEKFAAQRVA